VTRPRLTYLSRAEQEFVHEQTLRVLERYARSVGAPAARVRWREEAR